VGVTLPAFGRRRVAGAVTLSGLASALWITPAAVFPGAEVSPMLVTVGLVLPAGVAALTLTLMEQRIERDFKPAVTRPMPEHDRAEVRR
jgi:hypothetical protein